MDITSKRVISTDKYIKTLDGWRALAVIFVTLSHLRDSIVAEGTYLYRFFSWGINGVDLFFALSGYLISIKLIAELEKNKTLNLKKFYVKRFFRLMPASWFYLLVVSGFMVLDFIHVYKYEILSTVTFWRNYLKIPSEPLHTYTGQFWSLSVEEHFYFFLPCFLLLIKDARKIIWSLIALGVAVTVWRKLGTVSVVINQFPFMQYDMWSTLGRFDALLYGVLLAYVQTYHSERISFFSKIPTELYMVLLFLIDYYPIPLKTTLEALVFPLLIFSTVANDKRPISRFLELRPLKYIGLISYSFYIWQQFFVAKMVEGPLLLQSVTGEWHSLVAIFLVSSLSYHLIETPLRKVGYAASKKFS